MSNAVQPSKMDLSFEVAQRVELEDLHILRSVMMRSPNASLRPAKIEVSFSTSPELHIESQKLQIIISFRLQGKSEGDGAERAMAIETVYSAMYRLNSAESLTKEHFRAFAELNGIYHAWPFWREYIQTSTARMGLPGFTLPVLPPVTKQATSETRAIERERREHE